MGILEDNGRFRGNSPPGIHRNLENRKQRENIFGHACVRMCVCFCAEYCDEGVAFAKEDPIHRGGGAASQLASSLFPAKDRQPAFIFQLPSDAQLALKSKTFIFLWKWDKRTLKERKDRMIPNFSWLEDGTWNYQNGPNPISFGCVKEYDMQNHQFSSMFTIFLKPFQILSS